MGRPSKGLAHVDTLRGDPDSKFRLKAILATLSGELFVDEACEELDLGASQFANLRRQVLQGALDALEPRPAGRPHKEASVSEQEVETMRARIAELERDAELLRARLELAVLPLLRRPRRKKRRAGNGPAAEGGPAPE